MVLPFQGIGYDEMIENHYRLLISRTKVCFIGIIGFVVPEKKPKKWGNSWKNQLKNPRSKFAR